MNLTRYRLFLYLSATLIIVDLLLNTLVDVFRPDHILQLVLYVLQDTCLLLDIILIFLAFFSTYVFQAGLIRILISKFLTVIVVSAFYLGISITLHAFKLTVPTKLSVMSLYSKMSATGAFTILCSFDFLRTLNWEDQYKYIWNPWFLALYISQRISATFFYYFYKNTILHIGDPKYHKRSQWIQKELTKRFR